LKTFWLASYPKSGNTWFRVFLANLLCPDQAPVDPNKLPLSNLIASARSPFHEIVGVPPALLTPEEYDSLRPGVDRVVARDWTKSPCLRKAHDAYTFLPDGRPLMGVRPDFAAIYILRNPWDVAVSAANHWGKTLEQTVELMCRDNTALENRKDRASIQFRQRLLSWSGHVESWLKAPLDVCILRYEDLHSAPMVSFRSALEFMSIQANDDQIEKAIEASRFERLQNIEQTHGFTEAARYRRFFRSGQMGEGRQRLARRDQEKLGEQNERVEALLEEFRKDKAQP